MTDRVEVLTDGGSALYGSDAVAGVVNVIMRTDFEGFELYGDIQGVEAAGDLFDRTISAIWGWESDDGDTNFVISGEYFERDPVGEQYANFFDADAGQYNGQVSGVGVPLVLPGNVLNPAYIQSYASSLLASKQAQKAQDICVGAINIYPLNKSLRLTLAKCMLSNKQSDSAYRLLNELPLFSQKEADYLSLIIMTTPNKSGLESLMSKMKNFTDYQKLFPKNLIEKSPNSEFIIKNLSN